MKSFAIGWVCLVAAGLALVSEGRGVVVDPDGSKSVRGTTVAERPELAGGILRDENIDFTIRNASGELVYAGTLQDRVKQSKKNKTLSFEFRIKNSQPGLSGRIVSVGREGFSGWSTDMDFTVDGLGSNGPDTVRRASKSRGDRVAFSFERTPIASGEESRFCFVLTNATRFAAKAGSLTIIASDGSKVTIPVAGPET